jgi:hypothetical protein
MRFEMNKKAIIGQIWVPFIFGLIIVSGIAYFLFNSMIGDSTLLTQWADISLIYLLSPVIACSMVLIILGIVCIFILNSTYKKIHEGLGVVEIFSENMKQKTQDFCQKTISIFSGPSTWLKKQQKAVKNDR